MNITEKYLNKEPAESEMDCEVLPPDYQKWLDSLEVVKPEPEDFNSVDFLSIPF